MGGGGGGGGGGGREGVEGGRGEGECRRPMRGAETLDEANGVENNGRGGGVKLTSYRKKDKQTWHLSTGTCKHTYTRTCTHERMHTRTCAN